MMAWQAQHDDENDSPPMEGIAGGQGWVWRREGFPLMGPTPSACGGHPSGGGDFQRSLHDGVV